MSPGKGEVNCSNGLTILDYLNEYCWRAVLDYVPVKDIISSERVSSHWQKTVLTYLSLSHVRLLVTYKDHYDCLGVMMEIPDVTSFEVDPDVWPSFLTWTYKCGSLVVGVHCICMETLNIISENCPKLEGLALFCPITEKLLEDYNGKNFKFLRKLGFTFIDMSDQCFTKFINCTNDLEELYICNNETMTGECLNNVRLRNLKSLIIGYSPELKFHHLVSAVDHFSLWCAWKIAGDRLTNLSLEDCLKVTEDDVVSCIRSCPKLTSLSIRNVLDLTPDLVSRADAARCEMRATVPLRLFVYNTEQNTSDNTERVVSEKHIIIDHSQRNYWV
ncbi:uncharacterized protein LOC125234980 isoform X5 [Leguminivora glycinivorella]|uniref:uncharacterized protein LOC125234980 isoform X5 n=1 Tax=Leguminivora glycinivorella TaxID=1035111 RepID=UPI0020106F06|nr:uncharacterized protein LOC125234980 isoform X5 [Leguminivora glycinivorella]